MPNIGIALLFSVFFLGVICLFIFIYTSVYTTKLASRLQKIDYEKWTSLTSIGIFGPGLSNPNKWLRYIYSKDNEDDDKIRKYRHRIKIGLRQILFLLIAIATTSFIALRVLKTS